MINFQEHIETGYALRTWENAKRADLTIAFAIDFDTAGEKLTRKAAYGKYIAVDLDFSIGTAVDKILPEIKRRNANKLNIAGNGIYSLKDRTQHQIDEYIEAVILMLCCVTDRKFIIRSGGQTGVDEAALKAGDELGLETICLAPKGWLFRDETGRDIMSESLFLKRFGYDVIDLL